MRSDAWSTIVEGSAAVARRAAAEGARYELAGPETLTVREIVDIALRSFHRRRPMVRVPTRMARGTLKLVELLMGPTAFATDRGSLRRLQGVEGVCAQQLVEGRVVGGHR